MGQRDTLDDARMLIIRYDALLATGWHFRSIRGQDLTTTHAVVTALLNDATIEAIKPDGTVQRAA
jgi:hypothetical protein